MVADKEATKEWTGKTDGTPWMQHSLTMMMRVLPREILYAFMAIVAIFYMLLNRKGFVSMYDFFVKRMGYGPVRAFAMVYANHFRFGQVVIDRFAAFADKKFYFDIEGRELFDTMEREKDGFMLLSSHVGNYELAGYTLSSEKKQFFALVYAGETAEMMTNRRRLFSPHHIHMVPVNNDMSHIFTLNAALNEGNIVSMPADRIFGSQKNVSCLFFGAKARFPLGPFVMMTQKEVPAVAVFVMKETARRYHIILRQLSGDAITAADKAQQYAIMLEEVVRRYPAQWFNYYNFWERA